jgi:cobalt-zinc-cadmium efflux system protein
MPVLPHGESEADAPVLQRLALTVYLAAVVLGIEAVGALGSRSLALTTDAVHNIPDLLGFGISWLALSAARRGATLQHTFGLHRSEVFATMLNGVLLLGAGLGFAYEALLGILTNHGGLAGSITAVWILYAAVPTLLLRSGAALLVGRLPRAARDLNVRGVYLHLLGDIAIAVPLLVAALVLLRIPSLQVVDAIATIPIAAVLVVESYPLFRDSWTSLSERIPRNLSVDAIDRTARTVSLVEGLHDVHVWSVCSNLICMTAHVRTDAVTLQQGMAVVAELRRRMAEEFGIGHSVFELETETRPSASTT